VGHREDGSWARQRIGHCTHAGKRTKTARTCPITRITCAPTSRWSNPGAQPVVDIEAYRAMMQTAYHAMPDFVVEVDDQFATDDRVVCRWRIRGTHSADSFGFAATGKRIEYAG